MDKQDEENAAATEQPGMKSSFFLRCALALLCSHVGAPYAAARFTIRYMIGGGPDWKYFAIAAAAISVGACLAFRQMIRQPPGRKLLYGCTAIVLWFTVSFVLLKVASDSVISLLVLSALWGVGTFWVLWLVWGLSFFGLRGFVVGIILSAAGAGFHWSQVEITGLTGDARVEFAWRKRPVKISSLPTSGTTNSLGEISWGGYLGSDRNGVVANVILASDWAATPPEELWRIPCGPGWSSFAATESTLFGQEQHNGEDGVAARRIENGEVVWFSSEGPEGFRSVMGGDGPRATPTLHRITRDDGSDAVLVLAAGPTGILSCLNGADGSFVWKADLTERFPGDNLPHGVCASPLVVNDLVIACPPSPDGPCLAAVRLSDGQAMWQCDSDWRSSYASPQLMNLNGQNQIVLHAGPGVIAVSPEDGLVLWQFEFSNEWDNNATQPLAIADTDNELLIATGYRGGAARLSLQTEDNGLQTVTEVWKTTSTMKTKFCNMALFGNVAVGLDNGILCGVDAQTGDRLWKGGRYGHGQILKVGDQLIVLEERGRVHLLKPNADGHNPLGSTDALDRKTWNHPILIGDRLFVRNDQEIVCFQLATAGEATANSISL